MLIKLALLTFLPVFVLGGRCTTHPLDDFLEVQGQATTYFPPGPDIKGYVDVDWTNFVIFDAVGVWSNEVGGEWDHQVTYSNIEICSLPQNKEEVSVHIISENVFAHGQSVQDLSDNDWDFLGTEPIFGNLLQDVLLPGQKYKPVVGESDLFMSWTQQKGTGLRDAQEISFWGMSDNAPAFLDVRFDGKDKKRGTCAHVHQVYDSDSVLTDEDSGWLLEEASIITCHGP